MTKRLSAIILSMLLIVSVFAGCSGGSAPASSAAPASSEAPPAAEAAPASSDASTDAGAATTDAAAPIRIGYVCNFMSHEWYQNVCNGAKRRADELGVQIEIADANLDSAQQISFAENLMAKGIDVLALTPVDATALKQVVADAESKGIKVISESNPIGGERTTVGADNKESGKKAGVWMGEYAKANNIELKLLIVGYPNFEDCRLRVEGFKEGLESTGATYEIKQEIDSQGSKENALSKGTDALTANQDVNAIFGINDDSTQGAIQAYKAIGLDENKLVAVGFGLEGVVGREALLNNTPIKAELAMFPDFVGASLVDAAIKVMNGETVDTRTTTPTTMVTPDTYKDFYTQEGDKWVMNFKAIEELNK